MLYEVITFPLLECEFEPLLSLGPQLPDLYNRFCWPISNRFAPHSAAR